MEIDEILKTLRSGEIYDPNLKELVPFQLARIQKVNEYNQTMASPEGLKIREKMLKEMFYQIGEGCYIEPPFHANMGGASLTLGNYVYANFNLTLVDDGPIVIGNNVLFGPNVTIATAVHPTNHNLRKYGLQYNKKVTIGDNVWVGSGATILPGVNIGSNTIIGAGSIVTKDIPSNVIAFGNPCRVIRNITENDLKTYDHGKLIPQELLDNYK